MERRHSDRRAPTADEPLSRVRLRGGRELTVVNISNAGVLADGHARLLPGSHVDVHVVTREGRVLIRSRVVRCHVECLRPDAVGFRAGLAFERFIDTRPPGYAPAPCDDGPPRATTPEAIAGQSPQPTPIAPASEAH
jgi:hypothetical protein